MSLTASSLLARLEELKKWQAKQQQRLTEQQSSLKDRTNASSNFDTIEGLSEFNSTSEISRNDLKPPPRSILIERNSNLNSSKASARKSNNYNDETAVRYSDNSKLKMPYLRRGSGLVRYKMNPGDQRRPFNRIIQRRTSNNNNNTKTSKSYGDIPHDSDPVEITPLKRPDINIKAVWFKIGDEGQPIINNADRNLSDVDNLAKKTILQINELAAQNSICSDNANFKLHDEAAVKAKSSDMSEINEKLTEMALRSEQSLYEQQLERELLIFEALEEKALNSSFSSTNSSVLHILSSTPSKLKSRNLAKNFIQEKVEYQNHITDDIIEEIEEDNLVDNQFNQVERDKIPSLESSVTSDDFQDKPLEEAWSDINTIVYTRENSSLSSASLRSRKNSEPENTLVSQSDYTETIANKEKIDETKEILARKLKELDEEIENFRKENANLQRMKLQLEKEEREFKNEKRAFEKYILEEKINAEFYLEDEKKKLAKEKVIFERYVKDIQNKTTRKEREEISALKEEIANLREASKLKETRNATSQARLRNQIKSFEKEISNLREELENLRKRNAKLLTSQQFVKKTSETKMLHEINKNLTKLTKDVKVGEKLKKMENSLEKIQVAEDVRKNSLDRNEIKDFFYGQVRNDSKSKTDQSLLYNEQDLCKNYDAFLKDTSKMVLDKANGSVEHVLDADDDDKIDRSIERSYEMVFGKSPTSEAVRSDISVTADKSTTVNETTLADGSREITYPNGNVKTTSADGNYICMKYYNGDIKETKLLDGVIRYYYIENQSWQTTMADGTEILEFPNGQIERKFKDGSIEVKFPNGIVQMTKSNGSQTISYPDKTQVDIDANGEKIIHLPNGQKEIHNLEHMRREYPDGTVKIVYPDGIQETRYGNGRIRIKDKDGNLLLDSYDCNS